ncbi:type II secretion system minor pseudopilin GspK [Parahalioglobus pacificus]|uniref:Type II secretion system protein K n=1 Tax=Parahalioglobus pacificus TaxID=930806 RepID=A0A919CHK1_9GAMM|nr:type II secretion system minor pseudopilin GspK [Halioglobus pacificus]GHD26252.1 type II secretion system protein K [Halioglobus pacificus]
MSYRHSNRPSPSRSLTGRLRQQGAALVIALLIFAVCAGLMVAMQRQFTIFYQRGSNLFLGEQSQSYLRGAEDLASLALVLDYDQDKQREQPRDDLTEIWAQEATPYPLEEGGWLMGSLEDLQGRFNLNSLSAPARDNASTNRPRFTPSQMQFVRLLQALEENALGEQEAIALTEAIADWLDVDTQARFNGAEDDFYFGRTPAYRSANRPFASVSELRALATMTEPLYQALAPLVTVWPQQPRTLNIHTAPPTLLRTINANDDLTPLTVTEGQALVLKRQEQGFVDVEDLLSDPVFADRALDDVGNLLGTSSGYFLLSAQVEIAGRQARLYSVLQRRSRQVTSLVRASGSL